MSAVTASYDDFFVNSWWLSGVSFLYIICVYPLVNQHSHGKSPCSIGNTSSIRVHFPAILVYRRVTFLIFLTVDEFGGSPTNLRQKGWKIWASPAWPNNPFRRHLASDFTGKKQFFFGQRKKMRISWRKEIQWTFFFAYKLNWCEVDVLTTKSSERKTSSYIESLLSTGKHQYIQWHDHQLLDDFATWSAFWPKLWKFQKIIHFFNKPSHHSHQKARRFFLHRVSQVAADDGLRLDGPLWR